MNIGGSANSPCISKPRILVVESYERLCELYRELFQQAGYDVWTSSETDDVDEAIKE